VKRLGRAACFVALLSALWPAGPGARAADQCHLVKVTSVSMKTDPADGVYVAMTIAGHDENLLVDTGGWASMLSSSAVRELGLQRYAMAGRSAEMFGGKRLYEYAMVDGFKLGELTATQWPFLVMPDETTTAAESGTIAQDILRHYDVELDFLHAKLNLFSQDHCPGKVVYWTRDAVARVPMRIDNSGHIVIDVELDGKPLTAIVDSGVTRSVLRLEWARVAFRWTDTAPKLAPAGSLGDSYRYSFRTLTFQDVSIANPDILLMSDDVSRLDRGGPDLILGMGVLHELHVYIAYGEHALYLTSVDAH
jgi:predicted aspartyl protease